MGNYRFKLSDMIPNSWFYKLKDMSSNTKRNHKKGPSPISPTTDQPHPNHFHQTKSHLFTRDLAAGNSPPQPPARKSSKQKPSQRSAAAAARSSPKLVVTSTSGCNCARVDSVTAGPPPLLNQRSFHAPHQLKSAKKINGSDEELKSLPQIDLPPIITHPEDQTDGADGSTCPSVTIAKKGKSIAKEPRSSPSRRFPVNSPGPKFRIMSNSPRVSSKRFGHLGGRRKSGSSAASAAGKRSLTDDSLAIVKSTNDPQREFKESMVEMIVENKISASNELEDLLACYLSLNSHEFHDIIIKVFKQIWFDMSDIGIA